MNGVLLMVVAAAVLACGYLGYGRWLANKWGVDKEALTPAKRMKDGNSFSPVSAFTAFSHQFSSICGAGPVTGTIVAMAFGWLPVVLWVLVGGIFFGAVHDFGALYASMKNNGKSLAQLIEKYIGKTGRRLFLLFCWLFCIIVIAAFTDMVCKTFMFTPAVDASGAATGAIDFTKSYAAGCAGTISILFTFVAMAFGWAQKKFNLTGAAESPAWYSWSSCSPSACSSRSTWTSSSGSPSSWSTWSLPVPCPSRCSRPLATTSLPS